MLTTKTLLVILCIIITILSKELQSHSEVEWIESVTRLSGSHHIHTALIIHDHSPGNAVKNNMFGKIVESIPSATVELNDKGIEFKESDFGAVSKLSTSLLFMFYAEYSGDNVQIYQVIHSVNKLADFSVNCYLLIILRTSSNFERGIEAILQYAWKEKILNIVIIEIRVITDFQPKFRNRNRDNNSKIHSDNTNQVLIHQFNPFINTFYHKKFSPRIELFPNLAKNWHGHRLNVNLMHRPPFTSVTFDKNNNMKEMSGPNIVLMQTLATQLNFSAFILSRRDSSKFLQDDLAIEDLINIFETLDIDMAAHLAAPYTNSITEESMRSRTIVTQKLGMLMPKKYEIKSATLNKALESTALTLVIMMIVWFAAILLKFDKQVWQLFIIVRMIFSISVDHQPSRGAERILFFFVVMLGFTYSNDIYASLTNLKVDPFVETEYNTFVEIDDSALIPVISAPMYGKVFANATGAKLNLGRKSIKVLDRKECPQMAMVHRNVCCVVYQDEAEFYLKSSRPKHGQYQLKFAKQIFWSGPTAFNFRQHLPGKQNINQIIDRCFEAGILSKWYLQLRGASERNTDPKHDANVTNEKLQTQLLGQLIVVIVFGHSLATLVFIGELLTHRFKKSLKNKSKLNLCHVYKRKIK